MDAELGACAVIRRLCPQLERPSVVNCDGLHTITKASLTTYAGSVSEDTMERICAAVGYALGR